MNHCGTGIEKESKKTTNRLVFFFYHLLVSEGADGLYGKAILAQSGDWSTDPRR